MRECWDKPKGAGCTLEVMEMLENDCGKDHAYENILKALELYTLNRQIIRYMIISQ
jgi:hypothetical protein